MFDVLVLMTISTLAHIDFEFIDVHGMDNLVSFHGD